MSQTIQPEMQAGGSYFVLRVVGLAPSAGAGQTASALMVAPAPFVITKVSVDYTGGTSIDTGVTTSNGGVQFGAPASATVDPGPGNGPVGYNTAAASVSTPPNTGDAAFVDTGDFVDVTYSVVGAPTDYIVEITCLRVTAVDP